MIVNSLFQQGRAELGGSPQRAAGEFEQESLMSRLRSRAHCSSNESSIALRISSSSCCRLRSAAASSLLDSSRAAARAGSSVGVSGAGTPPAPGTPPPPPPSGQRESWIALGVGRGE